MDYKEKYNTALERARKIHYETEFDYEKGMMEEIFPELKEPNGERIRKELIAIYSVGAKVNAKTGDIPDRDIVAWLEKQGEHKPYGQRKECEDCQFNYAGECKGFCQMKKDEQKPADNVEPKFNIGDTMRTWREAANGYTDGMPVVVSIDNEYYHCTNELIAIKNQDDYEFPPINVKKNPVDKVEPKFHEGEWLCENDPNNYARFIQILEIVNVQGKERYRISRDIHNDEDTVEFGFVENYYHKFDIQDARDGDLIYVSTEEKGIQAIFHEYKNDTIFFHCYLCADFVQGGCMPIGSVELTYPLQKTHYNRFFEKMHEAGYEWDNEKKELRKIESKTLDAAKVIEWLRKNTCAACWDNPNEGVSQRIEQFKKDFGL